jgi:hypothetical protein
MEKSGKHFGSATPGGYASPCRDEGISAITKNIASFCSGIIAHSPRYFTKF